MSETLPPIYFVRHGETEWNRLGLIQGWTDIPLNETGHAQAQDVARAFAAHPEVTKDCRFAVSPLGRTRQTMAYISEALSLPESHVSVSPALKELGFGVWEGKPFWELKASPIYPADPETRYSWRPEGGESYADGQERLRHWLAGIQDPNGGGFAWRDRPLPDRASHQHDHARTGGDSHAPGAVLPDCRWQRRVV